MIVFSLLYAGITMGICAFLAIFSLNPIIIFTTCLIILDRIFWYTQIRTLINKSFAQPQNILPLEIESRRKERIMSWKLSILILPLFNGLYFFLGDYNITAGLIISVFLELAVCIPLTPEYFLCTTSLPPGEKERKQQEREMNKMIVQPSGT